MSASGLQVFDRTLQITNTWLAEIADTLGGDRQIAWHALGGVLRAVRDRVPLRLAAHFGAQLPLLVRGAYYDQWRPSDAPQSWRSLDEFAAIVSADMHPVGPVDPTDAARAVFQTLNHYVDPGQVDKVRHALPEAVRDLWPPNARSRRGADTAA